MRFPVDLSDIVPGRGSNQVHDIRTPNGIKVRVPELQELVQPQLMTIIGGDEEHERLKGVTTFARVQWFHRAKDLVHDLLRCGFGEIHGAASDQELQAVFQGSVMG